MSGAVFLSRRQRLMARMQELSDTSSEYGSAPGDARPVRPKRSLGQNFLISDRVVDRILFAVRSEPFAALIEVGPGLGAITDDLISLLKSRPQKNEFTVIELDRVFAHYWRGRSQAEALPTRVVEADALQCDWKTLHLPDQTLFVSNLPYQISSSLVIERSLDAAGVSRMVLMFQKEVAQRIAAQSGTKEYGLLTVIAQTFWETQTVVDAGPGDFYPPPKVSSRVLQFKRRRVAWVESGEGTAQGFLTFVKAAYSHRRKLLLRNLEGGYCGSLADAAGRLASIFSSMGLETTIRAEQLDPEAMVRLYLALNREGLGRDG